MAMSPRLLRPRQAIHPETASWASRVVANGASVSGTTLSAVDKFVKACYAKNIRDRFYRLNLFCGTGLNACLVPLYRGPSLGGTQYGNTTDTNVGPFVSGDYAETVASGGLKGNGTTKYLNTGVAGSVLSGHNFHASAYEVSLSTAAYDASMGAVQSAGSAGFTLGLAGSSTTYSFSTYNNAIETTGAVAGHWLAVQTGNRIGGLYRGGSLLTSTYVGGGNTASDWSAVSSTISIFNANVDAAVRDYSAARLGGYSFGLSMTAAQAAAYYTAIQAFQTALGRNV